MGGVLSTYAGSKDIPSLAGADAEKPTEYDYVICGGGTAGCVLASRLTENPDVRVLVIEAGESDARQLYSRIPAGWVSFSGVSTPQALTSRSLSCTSEAFRLTALTDSRSNADWNFETTPQPQMAGRKMYLPRGKMLGGCSAISELLLQGRI